MDDMHLVLYVHICTIVVAFVGRFSSDLLETFLFALAWRSSLAKKSINIFPLLYFLR